MEDDKLKEYFISLFDLKEILKDVNNHLLEIHDAGNAISINAVKLIAEGIKKKAIRKEELINGER